MVANTVEYFGLSQNIIGQGVGKGVIKEYLQRRGYSELHSSQNVPASKLHAYGKPPSDEASFTGTKKPFKTPKTNTVSGQHAEPRKYTITKNQGNKIQNEGTESRSMQKGNQLNSKKKKAGKVVSLVEAAKGSIVFQQGKPCSCQARCQRLVSNCLSCGKIVCEQEGEGICNFCGALVLREGSSYAGLDESLLSLSDAKAAAEAYAKRLVDYNRNSAARTTVIDDQSDHYEIEGNSWPSVQVCDLLKALVELNCNFKYFILFQENELLKKKREEIEQAERAKRNKVVVTFDLVGRKVYFFTLSSNS